MATTVQPGLYRHYKGGRYEVLGVGTVEATGEEVVIYRSLQDKGGFKAGSLWTRPVSVFTEIAEFEGAVQPRFAPLPSPHTFISLRDLFFLGICPFLVLMLDVALNTAALGWYTAHHIDIVTHGLGGAAIAFSAWYALRLCEKNNLASIKNFFLRVLALVAIVALAGVLWEVFEFWHDLFYGSHYQPSNFDTMKDLIMDTIGGLITTTLLIWAENKKIG